MRRKRGAARKKFAQEALQVVGVRIGQAAAALEEARRRQAGRCAGLLERPRFRLCALRRVEELVLQHGDLGRTVAALECFGPLGDLRLHPLFLLDSGERLLESFGRRGLETALAAVIEVHRRRLQLDQYARRLDRARIAPDILARKLVEAEFASGAHLPQEIDVELLGKLVGGGKKLGARRLLKGQQHVGALTLERRPCGLSTWNDAGAWPRTAPTLSSPSSS